MRWVYIAMPLVSIGLAYVLGIWVGGKGRRATIWAIALTLPLLLLRCLIRLNPSVADYFFPFGWYGLVHAWWAFPLAYFLMGMAGGCCKGRFTRGLAHVCIMLITITVLVRSAGEIRFNPYELTGRPDRWGLCDQTGNYSCGAAAAATLAGLYDVPVTESEMAEFCRTNPFLGTDPVSVQYGLKRKLGSLGYDVKIRRCDWRELHSISMPAMVLVKYRGIMDHWIVLLEVEEKSVTIADSGYVIQLPRGYFLNEWRGVAVIIEGAQPWTYLRYKRTLLHGARAA